MLCHSFVYLEVFEASENGTILRWMHLKPGISFRVEKMSGNYIKENGKSYA